MNLTKIRRRIRWAGLYFASMLNSKRNEGRIKPSKDLTDAQLSAVTITKKTILSPESKLYYNTQTYECYIYKKGENETSLYIFLEPRNIKIINTVFGYDISIDNTTEQYLTSLFSRELAKRRGQFKKEALAKVEYSLHKVLDKIDENH